MKRDLLKLRDLTRDEIFDILDLADQLKYDQLHRIPHKRLEGKVLAMIFAENSTRTRASFETGMFQLGGHAMYLTKEDTQISRGEPMEDTARTLSRYCDGILVRTARQEDVEMLSRYATVPVINGMTDAAHPCQALGDLMTIREKDPLLEQQKLCFLGNGNNVCSSLIVGCLKVGIEVAVACPEDYAPPQEVLAQAQEFGGRFTLYTDPYAAVKGADIVYTDAYVSMGQEAQREARLAAFGDKYQVNETLLQAAKPGAMVLHPLPARKNEEITPEVFEAHAEEIFSQAENRLHVQKAILTMLMG